MWYSRNARRASAALLLILFHSLLTVSAEDVAYCIGPPPYFPTVLCPPDLESTPHLYGRVDYELIEYQGQIIDVVPYQFTTTYLEAVPAVKIKLRSWDLYECLPDYSEKQVLNGASFVEYVVPPEHYTIFYSHDYVTTIHIVKYNSQG